MNARKEISRRELFAAAGLATAAGATGPMQQQPSGRPAERLLLKGGCVLTLDAQVGDFEKADVLIEGTRIQEVRPDIDAASATTIDATDAILMPGFVDTHRHMWQGALRNLIPDALLSDYSRDITGAARAVFRPEDAQIGNLITALGAINAGVTTALDWSHIGNSPEHSDAAIEGLRESGLRAVYGYGGGIGAQSQFPGDIRRLRQRHFSSSDQLLTLAMATGANVGDWRLAREVGAPITLHLMGANATESVKNEMRSDVTYIHCTNLAGSDWQRIQSSGGNVSLACPIEMAMGHGVPPILETLAHGIRPSLSTDVETEMPGDFFTQMRTVFTLQRMLALQQQRAGGPNPPRLLTARDVIEFATIEGARDNRLDSKIGTLTPGKEADVILLRMDRINVMPVNNVYGAIVLGMDTSNVDTVLIRGKIMKRHGQLVDVDLDRIRKRVTASRDYIVARAGLPRTLFGR